MFSVYVGLFYDKKKNSVLFVGFNHKTFRVSCRPSCSWKTMGAYHSTEKSGWGVESIMVSDLPVYRRIASSVTV